MNFTFVFLFLFSVLLINSNLVHGDDYFEKSIFKSLMDKNGQLKVNVKITSYFINESGKAYNTTERIEENYDYKNKIGEIIHYLNVGNKTNAIERIFYSNRINRLESYLIDDGNGVCYFEIRRWRLIQGISPNIYHNLIWEMEDIPISPNLMLELLSYKSDREKFKCTDEGDQIKKCKIKFENLVKFEYYLETKKDLTMYPKKIVIKVRNETTKEWKLNRIYEFIEFTPLFKEQKSIVDFNLPIGFGCQRPENLHEFYPQIQTNYGKKFKLELDVVFTYLRPMKEKETDLLTRSYSNKMFVDLNKSTYINIMETIDEFSNASIKTIYDKNQRKFHKINLDNDKCSTYNLGPNILNLNFFYIQSIFINAPAVFYFPIIDRGNRYGLVNPQATYLGEYKVDDNDYLVFERLLKSHGKKDNSTPVKIFKNMNQVKPFRILVTHYYLKKDNSPKIEFKTPKKIEIRIPGYARILEVGNLTINIKNFVPNFNFHDLKKYDTSKCDLHS